MNEHTASVEDNNEFNIQHSTQQFISPFLLKEGKIKPLIERLLNKDFTFFDIEDESLEDMFYGNEKISHEALETFFMPNIEPILFPSDMETIKGLRRFSKKLDKACRLSSPQLKMPFVIDSIDIFICPYHIGLLNIRVRFPEKDLTNNDVLTFADLFRTLIPYNGYDETIEIDYDGHSYNQVKKLIFEELLDSFSDYILNHTPKNSSYFGSLPFFKDERMFVVSYMNHRAGRPITETDLYRIAELNGYDSDGSEYVGALSPDYIHRFYQEKVYDRWADNTYYLISDAHFACITNEKGAVKQRLLCEMYGEYFYTVLLVFYYKLVLLKLSHEHSQIEMESDHTTIDRLTMMISEFSSKYYLPELSSNSSGKEILEIMKSVFEIDKLFHDVENTLSSLFQRQEQLEGKQLNSLLQILTIYTVISGIYGMNLMIDDLKGNIDWSKFISFSLFEWLAVFVTATGILLSLAMGFFFAKRWLQDKKNKKRKMF
ncbi:hypothetical protein [Oceanobacillus sp. FSL H7-0719]|uniref:hypothetical protein n=1 Tax=Oceanobacillus sp. FSL H7-0719 TaxID=2954507 RepID=UPI0032443B44